MLILVPVIQNTLQPAAAPAPDWLVPTPRRSWWVLAAFVGVFLTFIATSAAVAIFAKPEKGLQMLIAISMTNFLTIGLGALLVNGFARQFDLRRSGLWPLRLNWTWIAIAVGAIAALFPIRLALGYAAAMLFEGGLDTINARGQALMGGMTFSPAGAVISVIGVGVLAPIAEELLFRGGIFGFLRSRYGLWPSAIVSGALFGLAHFDSAGVAVASMLLGIVAAWAYERSGTITTPIALHIMNNTGAVLLLQLALLAKDYLPAAT